MTDTSRLVRAKLLADIFSAVFVQQVPLAMKT